MVLCCYSMSSWIMQASSSSDSWVKLTVYDQSFDSNYNYSYCYDLHVQKVNVHIA